ncbi:MAG: hypothetical protein QM765_16900 [Myxococcales bacterium]
MTSRTWAITPITCPASSRSGAAWTEHHPEPKPVRGKGNSSGAGRTPASACSSRPTAPTSTRKGKTSVGCRPRTLADGTPVSSSIQRFQAR